MLESHAPLLQLQIGSQFRRHQVFKLPYLDGEDVSAWGLLLASRLEQTLVGVRESPVFFMRVEDGQQNSSTERWDRVSVDNRTPLARRR